MTENFDIPDFSGDDFANDKGIQQTRAARQAHEKVIADSLAIVKNNLRMQNGSHKNLKHFYMFKSLQATLTKSFSGQLHSKTLQVSTATYDSYGNDQYLFGYFETKKEYPNTYIAKESLREKLANLVLKQDLDFAHSKKFSRRFHVLTEDKKRLTDLVLMKDLNPLTLFNNMELELKGNECLFRNSRRSISIKEAEQFCELAKIVVEIFD